LSLNPLIAQCPGCAESVFVLNATQTDGKWRRGEEAV
jgi:hypothetical protein